MNRLTETLLKYLGLLILGGFVQAAQAAVTGESGRNTAYRIAANDILEMRVFQEEDMTSKVRVAKDGTASFPLIGVVQLGGKTVEQATGLVRELLDKDYLVNPQVTLTVLEYSKRRFTVLGQVQRPGSYEIPGEETVSLLEAVAMAGGYTRLANASKITVSRTVDGQKLNLQVDGQALAKDTKTRSFEVLPDDTISVAERLF